jgi:hypothetical protein
MNTSELIALLQELEQEAGEPVRVQILVRVNESKNERVPLTEFDVELKTGEGLSDTVLIDMS